MLYSFCFTYSAGIHSGGKTPPSRTRAGMNSGGKTPPSRTRAGMNSGALKFYILGVVEVRPSPDWYSSTRCSIELMDVAWRAVEPAKAGLVCCIN